MKTRISRRKFTGGAAAALSFTIVGPHLVRAAGAGSKIKLGMLGCGGRGSWIASLFQKQGGYEISAAADYFDDRVNAFGDKYKVPKDRCFTGLSSYKKVIEAGVDAVAIISPPYFHPEQTLMAIEAGVHAYVAKPIAVDVPGCNTIGEAVKKAAGKLCLLVDFQTRANEFYIEAVKRVHAGGLGDLVFGEAIYHANSPFRSKYKYLQKDDVTAEDRLRAWGLSRALSGDIITEQNIHTLDVASWIMNQEPISACGTCGRKARSVGDCSDYFTAHFEYKDKVGITFSSKQFSGHGSKPDGIRNRMFGTKGVLEAQYGGEVLIRGGKDNFYRGGKTSQIYQSGAVNNIVAFHKAVTEKKFDNPTVAPSIRSTLVTILGRTAAYRREKVTWDEIVKSDEKMQPVLKGLKA
jgi:predicted dehydrogenase